MTIEVKQMIIKSTVTHDRAKDDHAEKASIDIELLREQLLAECRELIVENMESLRGR
ncbi:DUF5908 family protein [Pseudomonadota bacterium]